jgi:hypothetical protein
MLLVACFLLLDANNLPSRATALNEAPPNHETVNDDSKYKKQPTIKYSGVLSQLLAILISDFSLNLLKSFCSFLVNDVSHAIL